ncbi:MAG: hypothetical protein KJP21_00655 [Bacteroidia bacterium]|nr:hypothetical protein [Bacteroidia bacterium]NNJ56371.1 hypothetical protein [Bacteroidia bacterium]
MKKILALLVVVMLFGSCIKEITDTIDKATKTNGVKWSPHIALPLVYSELKVTDILEETGDLKYIRVENDGSLTAIYSDELVSKTAEDIINLTDQNYGETFNLTAGELATLNTNGQVVVSYNRTFDYVFSSDEIDKVHLKTGDIDLSISTTLQHDVSMRMILPEMKKSAIGFDETIAANYSGTLPNQSSSNIDITDYIADFTKTPQGHSQIDATIELTITKQGSNPIGALESVSFTMDLTNQGFHEVHGYFGSDDFSNGIQTLNLSVFNNSSSGSFTIADPRVKLVFENSFGVPIDANIIQFDGTNSSFNTVSLTGYPSPLPIPNLTLADIGQSKRDSFTLDKNNSNLPAYINNRPHENVYEVQVISNPSGPSVRNWFTDDSKLKLIVDIEVPLHGTAKDYEVERRQPFEFELEEADQVEEIMLRLHSENGFPVDIATQIYFEDTTTYTVLDSLLTTDLLIMPAADVDGNGRVNQINPKTIDVVFDAARTDLIMQANRVRIVARFNTTTIGGSQPDVKFYEEYQLLLQLGVQAKLLLNQEL